MSSEIYRLLIQAAESPSYISVRLRITFCLLIVTGIRINELLPLKVGQLQTLLESCWIGIDRSKRGPANHKAFLTNEGRKLVENKIIYNEVGVVLKSGKKKDQLIKNLTTSDITRRIEHIKFHEKIKNLEG
jgi:integrase